MGTPKKPITKKPAAEDSELEDDDDLDQPQQKVDDDDDFDGPLDDLDGYSTSFNDYDDEDDDF